MDFFVFLRLLDDERVVKEIERYKWIESERIGKDIGREKAAWEWIKAYGHIWLKIHKPKEYISFSGDSSLDRKVEKKEHKYSCNSGAKAG